MSTVQTGRMLLSHNFAIAQADVPALSREEFTQVMVDGAIRHSDITCAMIENPHWVVEVRFNPEAYTPQQVGDRCANALAQKRLDQKIQGSNPFHILALGGIKTSPAPGPSPTSLQPGEWGVDIIETPSSDQFLKGIDWDATIAANPPESIFKVDLTLS
jgi:Protein of unknown function (DUF2656)